MNKQIFLAGVLLGVSSIAFAHAKLQSAEPKVDSIVETAPKSIHLSFNTALEPAFSKIELIDAQNVAVELPKTEVGTDNSMRAGLPALKAGEYHVKWSTMTRDGHKVKGQYKFSVK